MLKCLPKVLNICEARTQIVCIISSYLKPQSKYMVFHIFTCIDHHLRVYYELTK